MTYQNPHAQLLKICPVCGKEFVTVAHYNQIYDTVQCYRRAKHKRRMNRSDPGDTTKVNAQRELIESTRYFTTVYDPSVKQLDELAKIILLELNDNKPARVLGTIPEWHAPKNIRLVKQEGTEPIEWNLVYREPSPLDDLLRQ